ncbi:RNase adapter RapZ [Alkalimarinus sediminis]|uniref:RNase adapter RapZ n=1 Tax=Alkalimarinus sediminis TaxID=1632866 RepID=A0A9E8KN98_9ALTE|nr:RNase adapter RapZ [Alkalimarinus sediminis]UZW73489.1 RNase adapter RapZ [Alkalimarinus sediminis]
MKLVIVSGRSGSGKSTALHVLEDLGFYCIDNLPIGLLLPLADEALISEESRLEKIAVSIDARNLSTGIDQFTDIVNQFQHRHFDMDIIYLDALNQTLLKRFHATRRKHPLSNDSVSLKEAIEAEKELLSPISSAADLVVDTSDMTMYQLRDLIKERVVGRTGQDIALLFQSFGFKHGVPIDADFVFDVRCLPNPYWDQSLRAYTGKDQLIHNFLEQHPETGEMLSDIVNYLNKWLPQFANSNRSYLTIGIGCTGGQHRSVYICEKLGETFKSMQSNVQVRHKELPSRPKEHD